MPEALFSIAIARDIIYYVATKDVEVDRLCAAVKLDPSWLTEPDRLISGELLRCLWHEAIAQTGDFNLGLHIGEAFDLAAMGILGHVLLSCQKYSQVLEKLSRYTCLFSQGVAIKHRLVGEWVQCDCQIVGEVENYLQYEPRHPIESTFAGLINATLQLTGNNLTLRSLWFQHPRPSSCDEHQRIFQTPILFSQPVNRLVFHADCLNWSVNSANKQLLSVLELHVSSMLSSQTHGQTYSQKVIELLSRSLPSEVCPLEVIARTLKISVRQLQRELKQEKTSYQQLLEETRRELALSYLKNQKHSIADAAFLLGFSEPSAFHRAFKRWTGQTPRNYRLNEK
jgi:AraC-like DNA-binding protein